MRDPVASRLPNRKAKEVFQRIRLKGTISKQELQEATGYTISTLTRLLEELVELGFIEETGSASPPAAAGRLCIGFGPITAMCSGWIFPGQLRALCSAI